MCENGLEQRVEKILEESFRGIGIEIVLVSMQKVGKSNVLQVLVDREDGGSVTLDDCIECNKIASMLLDVDNVIDMRYNLEISSPGENRPLRKIRDFKRFLGSFVKVELNSVINNRKRFRGKIASVADDLSGGDANIFFSEVENENKDEPRELVIRYSDIRKAILKRVFDIRS